MSDFVWCTRSFFVDFSLVYGYISNIDTTKITDDMVTELCYIVLDYIVTEHCPMVIWLQGIVLAII